MPTSHVFPLPRPFTLNDIHVGTKLYTVLVHHAATQPGHTVFYGDLLAQARDTYPEGADVKRAVPIGIGMKLLFVEAFCHENGYLNLACLAVNKDRRRPGAGFSGDWSQQVRAVAAFDLSSAQPALDDYVSRSTTVATPLKRNKDAAARELSFAHFRAHRDSYKDFDGDDREEMVSLFMEGIDIESALRAVLEVKAALD